MGKPKFTLSGRVGCCLTRGYVYSSDLLRSVVMEHIGAILCVKLTQASVVGCLTMTEYRLVSLHTSFNA